MATLAVLQARLDALETALDSSILKVQHGDESVTYRSLAEMRAVRDDLQLRINAANAEPRQRIHHTWQKSKGL